MRQLNGHDNIVSFLAYDTKDVRQGMRECYVLMEFCSRGHMGAP